MMGVNPGDKVRFHWRGNWYRGTVERATRSFVRIAEPVDWMNDEFGELEKVYPTVSMDKVERI